MSFTKFFTMVLLAGASLCAQAQTYKIVRPFNHATGAYPQGGLTLIGNGLFAGYSTSGGTGAANDGILFRVAANGKESLLHSFVGSDGINPWFGSPAVDSTGNLYGTTFMGGDLSCNLNTGCGAVYKFDSTGKFSVLYNFEIAAGGIFPLSGVTVGASGMLYGTTTQGPNFDQNGTVYQVNSSTGAESVVYQFTGAPDGSYPESQLVMDGGGNLYGTTAFGGSTAGTCGSAGRGTVFELTPNGSGGFTETILYRFQGGSSDGQFPLAITLDASGNIYGVTEVGGDLNACFNGAGCGVVYKLTKSGSTWTEKVLHIFTGFPGTDGAYPYGTVAVDTSGNVYGTTYQGGGSSYCVQGLTVTGCGTIFKIDTSNTETILHSFGLAEGAYPYGGLILDPTSGLLYGMTASGGGPGQGVVFSETVQ